MAHARIPAITVWPGTARAALAVLDAPLSLWGGLDLDRGIIADVNHPQKGRDLKGRVLAMRSGRGSSSSSSALVEAARRGTAPGAILLIEIDPILAIGALVAQDLYGVCIPILLCSPGDWPKLKDGRLADVRAASASATVTIAGL
jgi:predicted aconitase with swiveling domain